MTLICSPVCDAYVWFGVIYGGKTIFPDGTHAGLAEYMYTLPT